MKKLIISAALMFAAICSHAASVGWTISTSNTGLAGDSYMFFIVGQNDVASSSAITALLDEGKDVSAYAFGTGTLQSTGNDTMSFGKSGKSLTEAGSYNSFIVLFDSASPTAGTSKYVLIEGLANQTKTITATSASVTFATGAAGSIVNTASNWQSFGSVPEPTSGLLLLLGMAGLALKRKVA